MSELARKFYKMTSVSEEAGGFGVKLDARTLRTPGKAVFAAPTRALAEACAAEWDAQGEFILPKSMPLTQLAFATIDHTPRRRGELVDHVLKYAETDLLCHRAEHPADLAARQHTAWQSLLDWAEAFFGVRLPVVAGVTPAHVPAGEIAKLRAAAEALDDFWLTALAQGAGVAGSAVIAFALVQGAVTPDAAFEAAALDELWSLERWGEDEEARARLARVRAEIESIGRFVTSLGESLA